MRKGINRSINVKDLCKNPVRDDGKVGEFNSNVESKKRYDFRYALKVNRMT